jgi:hypothetical protein
VIEARENDRTKLETVAERCDQIAPEVARLWKSDHEQVEQQHQYVVERVKDVNGNDAFLRIDLTEGEECAIGHGFAIVREIPGMPPERGYLVPFCHEQHTSK